MHLTRNGGNHKVRFAPGRLHARRPGAGRTGAATHAHLVSGSPWAYDFLPEDRIMRWSERLLRALVALAGSAVLAVALSLAPAARASAGIPSGWIAAGIAPHDYEMGVDQALAHRGKA